MDLTALETEVIHELMRHSRQNPIRAAALGLKFGLNLRDINATVRDLRRKGILIGASKRKPQGYYIPGSTQEIQDYMAGFKAELFDMIKTYRIQKKASQEVIRQVQMGDLYDTRIRP